MKHAAETREPGVTVYTAPVTRNATNASVQPAAEKAKPRRIEISHETERTAINA